MNRTFVTNTNIAPIVDVSTYGGPFSYEFLWQPNEDAAEGGIVRDDYDSAKMGDCIVAEANMVFGEERPLADADEADWTELSSKKVTRRRK